MEDGNCGCCHSHDVEDVPETTPSERFMRPADGSKQALHVQKKLAGWQDSLSFQEKLRQQAPQVCVGDVHHVHHVPCWVETTEVGRGDVCHPM